MNNKKSITIRYIAKLCNVSPSTVSMVLNQNPKISAKTREKVLRVINKLDYYPNYYAKMLSKGKTNVIALVLPSLKRIFLDYYFAQSVSGIYETAREKKYDILLIVADEEFVNTGRYISLFKEKRIDGMIYVGSTLNDEYLAEFQELKYPFILLNSYLKNVKLPGVHADAVNGVYNAIEYLIKERNRRKIAFLSGPWNVTSTIDKFKGYKKALAKNKIKFRKALVIDGDFSIVSGEKAVNILKEKKLLTEIDGIFCCNDLMAKGVIEQLKREKIKIPEDIAVIGYDNHPVCETTTPRITTIEAPIYEISKKACELLIKNTGKESPFPYFNIKFPVKLIKRESA